MKSKMPLYEVKYYGKENSEDISDIDLLQKLHETFYRVIPAIQQILEGDLLLTPEAVYRLKVQGKAKTTQANM
jgi:hypothetical protein